MKRFFTTLLLFFCFYATFSQHAHNEPCGFNEAHARMLQADPQYRQNVELNEKQILEIYKHNAKSGGHQKAGVVTIPIVFHVIHKGEALGTGSNISDAQLQSAVDGMNIQYRNKNPDGSTYDPSGIDLEMEFCLAQKDPNGQPTSGINRVNGSSVTNYSTQGIINSNEQAVKALSKWDNKKYYNVWVVAMIDGQNPTGGGTQGYAYFPGAGPNVDGTVVLYNACGYCPTGTCPGFNLKSFARDNGTMVHEIGHAFSLYHTFEGGNSDGSSCPGAETDCNNQGDRVCDTPPHRSNLGSCKAVGSTNDCTGGTYNVNIARNYMNYTNCTPLIFTPGQRDRIKATFATTSSPRYSLTVSDGCDPVFPYDVAFKKLIAPSGFQCDNVVNGSLLVKNTGANALTSFNIEYGIDGTVLNTYSWSGNIVNNTETTIALPPVTSTTGTHNFFARVVKTSLNGSQTDGYPVNDNLSVPFEIINGTTVIVEVADHDAGDEIVIKKTGGAIVKTIKLDNAGALYTEAVCLPNDCYDFTFTDESWIPSFYIVNGQPGKVPAFKIKDPKGFVIASAFANPNTPPPGGVQQPKTETVTNKCIPFNPGYLEADFKADKTIIEQGKTVLFTDLTILSAGSPSSATNATSWEWDFGDGGTSNIKNPAHQYNTPGVYTVSLIADNGVVPDTVEKLHYIRVLPALDGCDQFNNLLSGEVPGYKTMVNGVPGYYPGPNMLNPAAYAEKFWTPATSNLKSIDVFISKRNDGTGSSTATFTVYSSIGGKPGSVLGSTKFPISNMVEGQYNNIPFVTAIPVSDFYFIAMQVNTANSDTVVLAASDYRGVGDLSNTAYIYKGGQWIDVPTAITGATANSLAISTNLSFIPVARIESDVIQTCEGKSILFDATTSDYVTSYNWNFQDGTPAVSTAKKPDITYTSQGEKEVELIVMGGCNEYDTLRTTIKVAPAPSVTVTKIDEVCGGANGEATALPVGGSGSYSFSWSTVPPQYGKTATGLREGTYFVKMTDLKCGEANASVVVDGLDKLSSFPVDVTNTTCGLNNGSAKANPVGGTGNYTYKWTMAGDPGFLKTSRVLYSLAPGTYTVEVHDGSCNPNQETIIIAPSSGVNGAVALSKNNICQGEQTVLSATGGARYSWSDISGPIGTDPVITVTPEFSNTYTVQIYDNTTCVQEIKTDVSVIQSPKAFARVDIDSEDNYLKAITLDLKDGGFAFFSSAASVGTKYFWRFGDGDTSSFKNPYHKYDTTGVFNVLLEVSIEHCKTLDSCEVTVIDNRTGISTIEKSRITLFPNPTTGTLYLNNPENITIDKISVFDVVGREVIYPVNSSGDIRLDLSTLNKGIYFVNIITGQGTMISRIELIK